MSLIIERDWLEERVPHGNKVLQRLGFTQAGTRVGGGFSEKGTTQDSVEKDLRRWQELHPGEIWVAKYQPRLIGDPIITIK